MTTAAFTGAPRVTDGQVALLIRLAGVERMVTDRGDTYPVAEWETIGTAGGHAYRLFVLGYLEVHDGLWVWRAELSDHAPEAEDGGAAIFEYQCRDFSEITAVVADLLTRAEEVLSSPDAQGRRERRRRWLEHRGGWWRVAAPRGAVTP